MNIIYNNPYRILGISSSISEKELKKQISIIRRYLEIGKQKKFSYDFDYLGEIIRNQESVINAANMIEHPLKKMEYSLFWFVDVSEIDKKAFHNLQENNIESALEIWEKGINADLDIKSFAYLNLSTLYISLYSQNPIKYKHYLLKGLQLKSMIFNNDIYEKLKDHIIKNTNVDRQTIIKSFVDDMLEYFIKSGDRKNELPNNWFTILTNEMHEEVKICFGKKIITNYTSTINKKLDKCAEKRKQNPKNALKQGKNLFMITKGDLININQIYNKDNTNYSIYADKIAKEILQCSTDYYNKIGENLVKENVEETVLIVKLAKKVAQTQLIINRINDSLEVLNDWINHEHEIKSTIIIKLNLDNIDKILSDRINENSPINDLRQRGVKCKSELNEIGNKIGYSNELHKNICNGIVTELLNKYILLFNNLEKLENYNLIKHFAHEIRLGCDELESIDISGKGYEYYYNNIYVIRKADHKCNPNYSISSNISNSNSRKEHSNRTNRSSPSSNYNSSNSSNKQSDSNNGCYIATMVYGDYENPRIICLREYRDNILLKRTAGKMFVKIYYYLSPKLVKKIKNKKRINKSIKNILNKFTEKLGYYE